MYEQILQNYLMGFLSARETAVKLIEAGFPEDLQAVLNEKIRENMERIRIEERSYNPCVKEANEILAVGNWDQHIEIQQVWDEGILNKIFIVELSSQWKDAKGTFEFDNFCHADNNANLSALKKWVEEN